MSVIKHTRVVASYHWIVHVLSSRFRSIDHPWCFGRLARPFVILHSPHGTLSVFSFHSMAASRHTQTIHPLVCPHRPVGQKTHGATTATTRLPRGLGHRVVCRSAAVRPTKLLVSHARPAFDVPVSHRLKNIFPTSPGLNVSFGIDRLYFAANHRDYRSQTRLVVRSPMDRFQHLFNCLSSFCQLAR